MKGIFLVGMPGSGKTTVGTLLARRLGLPFYDTDQLFSETYGITPADFLAGHTEKEFRALESEVLKTVCEEKLPAVVATGGGIVTVHYNMRRMNDHGDVVWLDRPLSELATEGRPLSQKEGVEALYERREILYRIAARIRVPVTGTPLAVTEQILTELRK